jgi:hypothetical protein
MVIVSFIVINQFVVWFLRVDYLGMTEAEPQIISALSASGKAQNARESI